MHRKSALFCPPTSRRRGKEAGFFRFLLPYTQHDLLKYQQQKKVNTHVSAIVAEYRQGYSIALRRERQYIEEPRRGEEFERVSKWDKTARPIFL